MEFDFVTRQHIDSLTPFSDPGLAEVLNNYKFPPASNPTPPQMAGYGYQPTFYGSAPNNNDMLLGSMLGQLQANMQNQNNGSNLNGLQLNINTEVLRWLLLVILLAILIWLVLKVKSYKKNPLKHRLRKLEKEIKKMRKRKNPKALETNSDLDDLDVSMDDLDEY